jgi:hypothetical protein
MKCLIATYSEVAIFAPLVTTHSPLPAKAAPGGRVPQYPIYIRGER